MTGASPSCGEILLSSRAVTLPRPRRAINICCSCAQQCIAPLRHTLSHFNLHIPLQLHLFKSIPSHNRQHGSPILRRRKLQDVCNHPSSEYLHEHDEDSNNTKGTATSSRSKTLSRISTTQSLTPTLVRRMCYSDCAALVGPRQTAY